MLMSTRRQLEAVVRDSEGRTVARCLIRRGRYIIGHEKKNEIFIDEGSVSSRHARLTVVTDEEMQIEDLGSANGTMVDGTPASGVTTIPPGARIQIGLCTLGFQRAGLPASVFKYLPEGFLHDLRYQFGEAIVEGRTSTIFTALDTTLGRDIAVKVMKAESQTSAELVLRFVREAQITSQLQHPGILTVYELGLNDQKQLYYTTRFVEGDSLGGVLDSMSVDPAATARNNLPSLLTAWQKAADAVAYANARGVVHAGLRPESITLGGFGEVVVLSWCFARVLDLVVSKLPFQRPITAAPIDAIPPLTPYCAPEVAEAAWDEVSERTDVYSLGAILYRIVTLHRPIVAEEDAALFEAIVNGSIRPPATFANEPHPHCPGGRFPGALLVVIMKALSRNPADRFESVPDLQAAVSEWQQGLVH